MYVVGSLDVLDVVYTQACVFGGLIVYAHGCMGGHLGFGSGFCILATYS